MGNLLTYLHYVRLIKQKSENWNEWTLKILSKTMSLKDYAPLKSFNKITTPTEA